MRGARILRWLLFAWVTVVVAPASLRADPPTAGQPTDDATEAYDAAIAEGLQHFAATRWQEAYEAFARAHFLRPSARTQRGMGMAAFNLGRIAEARRHLEVALDAIEQPLSAQQREHVRELLAQARARSGRYTVRVSPAHAELELDGQVVLERVLVLDRGTHELALHAEGQPSARRTLEVRGGEDEVLELGLTAEGQRPAPTEPLPIAALGPQATYGPDATPAALDSTGREAPMPWGPIVLGVSGGVLVGALVTGLLEQGKEADLDALCPDRACEPDRASRASALSSEIEGLQTTTDVLLLAGLVGAGIGTWLWLSADDDARDSQRSRPQLVRGPGELGLSLRGRLSW